MRMSVSATRMELLRLRRRLVVAQRGHKLLKDKQEQLMRKILELIATIKGERRRLAEKLKSIQQHLRYAEAGFGSKDYFKALSESTTTVKVEIGIHNVVNINVPYLKNLEFSGTMINYKFAYTSAELDIALYSLKELLPSLINMAISEKTLELLAEELERTRRRVNALEYVLIPQISEAIKYITMKLSEAERANLTRLLRLKEIIRGS
ncbi:MAG: V-type ATP synthase subunit D [candidate division WOR-3 bacterium]|nr:V-type ATP synthase subunit D [candidate division WOR-3 bacterium]